MAEILEPQSTSVLFREKRKPKRKPSEILSPKLNRYIKGKYIAEYIIALGIFICLSPLLLTIAILVKLDSRGDVLFKHKRYGLCGEPFYVYKFRTMIDGAHDLQSKMSHLNEMDGGKLFKSDNDPRVTSLGKFLRKTSLDELPQLINILKGEMTIIGPRPISTPISDYEIEELNRFRLKPGLGCIWQAYFRHHTDFTMWMKTDIIYIKNVSFKLDLKLFFTILKGVLLKKGAR
jgi:lipopolysaccharide/colanic/teichoic acid biosynthesis glycosyltransferase